MSSAPPNMPPGGGTPPPPYPPYDPKTQWRVYREQQRAAWRAQRDAWKAQRYAMKAGYVGTYGPRVPSIVGPIILIGIGIIAMLVMTGHIAASQFWAWYGRWWPLLLIGAGLALLAEWAVDLRRETPIRRGGGFIGILVILAIVGFAATGVNKLGAHFDGWNDNNNFFGSFSGPEHDNDQQVLSAQIPPNSTIEIQDPIGNVSVMGGDGSTIEVQAHEVAYAESDAEAKKIFNAEAAQLKVSGNSVLVKSDSSSNGKLHLTITVPKTAKITVNAGRGDVTAAGLGAGINVTAPHGDVHLNSIAGSVEAHLSKGEFSAHEIQGDVSGDGPCSDITISDISGKVGLNCDFFDQMHIEHVTGQIHFRTSKTDVQVEQLPGDLSLTDSELHVTEAKGPVHVVTHSRDIELNQIYGDTYVESRNGGISIAPAGPYNVEAKNSKGDVEVTLPPNASATVDGRTRNGDVFSDFGLAISGDESKTVSGRIGSGGTKITVSTDVGDVRIKKSQTMPPAPPVVPTAPKSPAPPNAPHLKTSKTLPQKPVTQ